MRMNEKKMNTLKAYFIEERQAKRKGGLYHKTQVNLAYNSNRIEGSRLTEEQTRYIFETRTIGFKDEEAVPVDDIIETSNHFVAFDHLIDTIDAPLSSDLMKEFHRIVKTGTSDAVKSWFKIGDWKKLPNEVGGLKTTSPQDVEAEISELDDWYNSIGEISLENIVEHHYRFEKIHPFQDGNGRVGRLLMFRECLKNDIVPFIIDDDHKQFYYRGLKGTSKKPADKASPKREKRSLQGVNEHFHARRNAVSGVFRGALKEFASVRGNLMDTCLSAQDIYAAWIDYFYPELSCKKE
jgi:Fic family protein